MSDPDPHPWFLTIPEQLIWDQLAAELGPLYDPVDTDLVVLEAMALCARLEGQTC